MAEAHRLKLVHRDIKPSNLLRTPHGMIKVADSGLARELFQETDLTRQGSVLGTPSFVAPEQWRGKPTDARSDLYSLTCTYYFLLTGRPPFEADNWAAVGYLHLHEPFPDPRSHQREIPAGVWKVIQRGSRKDQAGRYSSADQMLADLEVLLDPPPAPRSKRAAWKAKSPPAAKKRRNWQSVTRGDIRPVAGIVAGVTVLAFLLVWWFGGDARKSKMPPTVALSPGQEVLAGAVAPGQEMANPLPMITNSLGMKLAVIPAGEFQMGSPPDEEGRYEDEHLHRVWITNPFYLGVYEMTQAE